MACELLVYRCPGHELVNDISSGHAIRSHFLNNLEIVDYYSSAYFTMSYFTSPTPTGGNRLLWVTAVATKASSVARSLKLSDVDRG